MISKYSKRISVTLKIKDYELFEDIASKSKISMSLLIAECAKFGLRNIIALNKKEKGGN